MCHIQNQKLYLKLFIMINKIVRKSILILKSSCFLSKPEIKWYKNSKIQSFIYFECMCSTQQVSLTKFLPKLLV